MKQWKEHIGYIRWDPELHHGTSWALGWRACGVMSASAGRTGRMWNNLRLGPDIYKAAEYIFRGSEEGSGISFTCLLKEAVWCLAADRQVAMKDSCSERSELHSAPEPCVSAGL